MSKEPPGLDVSILGRQFRIACREEERRELLQAVQFLDERMRAIRDSVEVGNEFGGLGMPAPLAPSDLALRMKGGRQPATTIGLVATDAILTKPQAKRIAIMAALNIAHELLTTRVEGGFDIGELKRRMQRMTTAIEQTLSAQDELF